MKATKALKRLDKIEAMMSDVIERYVTLAPGVRKALKDAMAAVAVAKEAVSLDASSRMVKNPTLKQAETATSSPMKKTGVKKAAKARPVITKNVAQKTTKKSVRPRTTAKAAIK